jgi:methionyl-tRNA formyltransferase
LRSLVYLGTPAPAVPPLRALVAAGHEVRLVVTGPDRRRGRGTAPTPSPVKAEARRLGLPVAHDLDEALGTGAQLGVVVAYGHLVPERVLQGLPMLNLHFSLLPRWRGAAPVERAILAGDQVTGVCVMALERELDTGPLYACEELSIVPGEHLGPLRDRLVAAGTRLLVHVLDGPLPEPRPQRGEPTYAGKLDPAELRLTFERPAPELERVVRLERAWTTWRSRRLLVLDAEAVAGPADGSLPPGTLEGDAVAAATSTLRLRRVQPEGRAPMPAAEWLRGARPLPGERVGAP